MKTYALVILAVALGAQVANAAPKAPGAPPAGRGAPSAAPGVRAAPRAPAAPLPLRTISWPQQRAAGKLVAGEIVPPRPGQDFEALRVENTTARIHTFTVAVLDSPGIRQADWVLTGRVEYVGVEGRGYLEVVCTFPDGEVHFVRTLARAGKMEWLEDTESWREFALPFHSFKRHRPAKLVVNVVLPRRGMVELGPLVLFEGTRAYRAALDER
jgi:hypothetical protein